MAYISEDISMTVICFGDSNTWGYDPTSYWGSRYHTPWPEQLAHLSGQKIVNAGENGQEIPRYERTQNHKAFRKAPADLLVIMLGTNDLLQGSSPETAAERMEAFLSQLTVDRSRILLIAPPKMQLGTWVPNQQLIDASAQLAKYYQEISLRMDIRFADSSKWNIPLTYDGVHFTDVGHILFAEKLLESIKVYFPTLPNRRKF